MPDQTQTSYHLLKRLETEEREARIKEVILQQKVTEIYKRWRKFSIPYALGFGLPALVGLLLFIRFAPTMWILIFSGLAGAPVTGFTHLGRWYSHKVFLKQLTPEDYDVLETVSDMRLDTEERKFVIRAKREYQKINPQSEYLRASAKAEDGTLLRAAAYTDTTPQDQLLRPSQNPPAE